jgi:hypothetical protein
VVTYQVHLSVAQSDHRFAPLMPVLILVFTLVPLVIYLVKAMRKR